MSYPSILLNLSTKPQPVIKPKARHVQEQKNSNPSPSPPKYTTSMPEVCFHPAYRNPPMSVHNSFKGYENYPLNYLPGPYPPFPAIKGDPTRLPSSILYPFNIGSPAFRTLQAAVHPYYGINGFGKLPPHYFQGYESLFLPAFRRPKRVRTAFNPSQLLTLEEAFEKNHYAVGSERKRLAETLGLSELQIKVWFQNRRTKHKRQKLDGESCSQKNKEKDCLDSRESSRSDGSFSSSEDDIDDDDETGSCRTTPSSPEIDPGNSVLKNGESSSEFGESCKSPTKPVPRAIWNPIMLLNDRTPYSRTEVIA